METLRKAKKHAIFLCFLSGGIAGIPDGILQPAAVGFH